MADEPIRGKNYVSTNRFYIEMESTIKASFSECSSIGIDIELETHDEGGVNDQIRLMLGQPKSIVRTFWWGIAGKPPTG